MVDMAFKEHWQLGYLDLFSHDLLVFLRVAMYCIGTIFFAGHMTIAVIQVDVTNCMVVWKYLFCSNLEMGEEIQRA